MKQLRRLIDDESGQDLIEYGLLLAAFVTAAVAVFPSILEGMGTAFRGWIPAVNGLSESPPPR
jgi:Flp pilus assembly pilin Flp